MAFNLGKMVEGPSYAVLNEILGEYRTNEGFSRPSRYEILLLPPTGVRGTASNGGDVTNIFSRVMGEALGNGTVRSTSLRCDAISFPGRNLDTTPDTNIYGPTREIVDGYSYAPINATFQCASDMREKTYFETWQRLAYNPQTWSMGYYHDYVGTVQIYQLDENNKRRYGVELVEAFPKTIAEQALSYDSTNQINKVSITFSYRYWKNLTDEADLPKPLQDRIANILVNTVERRLLSNLPKVFNI